MDKILFDTNPMQNIAKRLDPRWRAESRIIMKERKPEEVGAAQAGDWVLDVATQQRRYLWETPSEGVQGRDWFRDKLVLALSLPKNGGAQARKMYHWAQLEPTRREDHRTALYNAYEVNQLRLSQARTAMAFGLPVVALASTKMGAPMARALAIGCGAALGLGGAWVASHYQGKVEEIAIAAQADYELSKYRPSLTIMQRQLQLRKDSWGTDSCRLEPWGERVPLHWDREKDEDDSFGLHLENRLVGPRSTDERRS